MGIRRGSEGEKQNERERGVGGDIIWEIWDVRATVEPMGKVSGRYLRGTK